MEVSTDQIDASALSTLELWSAVIAAAKAGDRPSLELLAAHEPGVRRWMANLTGETACF
jgi:hypothetical protein